jgi:hypothetical protein
MPVRARKASNGAMMVRQTPSVWRSPANNTRTAIEVAAIRMSTPRPAVTVSQKNSRTIGSQQ